MENESPREYMSAAFILADALQMKLNLIKEGDRYALTGEQTLSMSAGKLEVEFTPTVKSSIVRKESCAVLVQVFENLWVLVSVTSAPRVVSLALIDGPAVGLDSAVPDLNKKSLSWAVSRFATGTMAVFERPVGEEEWRRTDVVDIVDPGFSPGLEKDGGAVDTAGVCTP